MNDRSRPVDVLIWLVLCLAAMAGYWWATDAGIGVSPDSTAYLAVARHWLEPWHVVPLHGPSSGMTYFGPLYPASLAVASVLLRHDPVEAARWLNLVVLPINLLLVGSVLRKAVPSSTHLPWIGAAIFATAPDLMTIHTNAWSEAMFLSFLLSGFLLIDRSIEPAAPLWTRAALTAVLAAACLQRSAGTSLVLAASAALMLWSDGPLWRRVGWATTVGAFSLLPTVGWNLTHPGFQSRGYHPVDMAWMAGWRPILARWVVPYGAEVSEPVREWLAVLVAVLGALFAVGTRAVPRATATSDNGQTRMVSILVLFAAIYLVVICAAASFWDALIVPDGRLSAPLWTAVMMLVLIGINRMLQRQRFASRYAVRLVRALGLLAVVAWVLATGNETRGWLVSVHQSGQGYGSRAWKESPTIAAIESLPAGTFLVSAGNDAITAVTGRAAARLPDRENPATRIPNAAYAADLERVRQQLIVRNGVVVFFDRVTRERPYIPGEGDLLRDWRLRLVVRTTDGGLYRVDSSTDSIRSADSRPS